MKKIMFNDRYGLTEAVLTGRKTQTRRVAYISQHDADILTGKIPTCSKRHIVDCMLKAKYKIGEIVAIAQSYKDADVLFLPEEDEEFRCYNFPAEQTPGWTNKMFVRADLMPHHIRITNVRVERLQDISDEDCIKEGIYKDKTSCFNHSAYDYYKCINNCVVATRWYSTPRKAYAALIDRISGKGTWETNPYVFVYDFELVK